MSIKDIFQKFFNKEEPVKHHFTLQDKMDFEIAVQEVVKRYSHKTDELKLDDKLFADVYLTEFTEWMEIKTPSDRRRVIYRLLDPFLWDKVELWEKAERLIEARLPIKTLELLEGTDEPDDATDMYYGVFGKLYVILHEYDPAILKIQKGLDKFPDSKYLKIQLADYYYCVSQFDKYSEVIKVLMPDLTRNQSKDMNVIFDDIFSYHKGKLRSVAFAVNLGNSLADPKQIKTFWERASDEFYFHPVFRLEHAKYIMQNRNKEDNTDIAKAFVKYFFLLKEMPWQKEAAINALSLCKVLGIKDERYIFIKNIIDENEWNSEGMNSISV